MGSEIVPEVGWDMAVVDARVWDLPLRSRRGLRCLLMRASCNRISLDSIELSSAAHYY